MFVNVFFENAIKMKGNAFKTLQNGESKYNMKDGSAFSLLTSAQKIYFKNVIGRFQTCPLKKALTRKSLEKGCGG